MVFILRKENPTTRVMEIATEQQIRALTSNKLVFLIWFSPDGFSIKFNDSTIVAITNSGHATYVDYLDRSRELRSLKELGELVNRKP